jgi:HEAT repeat protein
VRLAAAEILGRAGTEESIPTLREALKDQDEDVREAAAHALGQLGDRESIPALREALKDQDSDVRLAAAGALRCLGDHPESVSELIEVLAAEGNVQALDVLWPEAKERLLAGLRTPEEFTWGAEILLRLGREETVPALIEALNLHGTGSVAQWYLNCGNPRLEAAARRWAEARGYKILSGPGVPAVRWGEH